MRARASRAGLSRAGGQSNMQNVAPQQPRPDDGPEWARWGAACWAAAKAGAARHRRECPGTVGPYFAGPAGFSGGRAIPSSMRESMNGKNGFADMRISESSETISVPVSPRSAIAPRFTP